MAQLILKLLKKFDKTEIIIMDTGIGIKPEEIDKICGRYYRTYSVKQIDGSGLSLNIAKLIKEAHTGSIIVSCGYESGTGFKIVLPG